MWQAWRREVEVRVLCARHPHLGLIAALRRYPELRGEPVILGGAPELRLPVVAASAAAQAAGVRVGQPLRQAQQCCPAAVFVPLDPDGMSTLRAAVCAELHRLSPTVEAGDEEAFADLSGRHAEFPDEASWASALARGLRGVLDVEIAVGVAGSRFVARLAARASHPGRIRRVRSGEEARFLAPLPLDVLPVDPAVTARLAAFGLDCLGAVAGLGPADLQRQFGPDGLRLHRLARGEDGAGILPAPAQRVWSERLVLDGATGDLETLLRGVRQCAAVLGARLAAETLAAGEVSVVFELEEAAAISTSGVPAAPPGNAGELWTAALGMLGELQPWAPVAAVRVGVTRLVPAAGRQADLLRPGDGAREAVVATAERLRSRFGAATVRRPRLALDPGDLPERRFTWEVPAVAGSTR
jgi:DNA polymerase IV